MNESLSSRIAVCSWSLQPAAPQDLVRKLHDTGIKRVQLALDPLRDSPDTWGRTAEVLQQAGLTAVSGMLGCVGEDYSTLESIRLSGGVSPDATWQQNLKNAKATALQARKLGLGLVTFHAGFIPHDPNDAVFSKMLQRLAAVDGAFAEQNILLGLETGQETANDLLRVLKTIGSSNICINFDPANMILYDKGNPIEALQLLGPWVRQVHIKDATRTKVPGTWGSEVPVGTGEVDWAAFFRTLSEIGFKGNFVIEREAGTNRVKDIRVARKLIEKTCAN